MGYTIYVDESIHTSASFILTAAVCAPGPINPYVADILTESGLRLGIDEYKSSAPKAGNEANRVLREQLGCLVGEHGCGVALVVSHLNERPMLGRRVLTLLEQMRLRGRFKHEPIRVYFDRGILSASDRLNLAGIREAAQFDIDPNDDSKTVLGLQLADLMAHMCSTILRCDLGDLEKAIPAGPNTPFDPDMPIELEYELWSWFRDVLASNEVAFPEFGREPVSEREYDAFGLYITPNCDPNVASTAYRRFAHIYMGCIL